ncbi:hypothetical protein [Xanthobacter oligotrophicus]|uniref:hypothetical protein n=1 Tax=Xanthobacter oligotrophicus TaxID=2607286 RepID=UPI0011F3194E|nr:hypothetical protein [Xanthobacter oligotrophicus]MCG5234130.1 hypothetical protein [Xanthobacter oligotrophicus]
MNDSTVFQGLARAFSTGTPPVAWPFTVWKNLFFDCPLAASAHVQQFVGRQMQEQVQLLNDLAKEHNPTAAFSREAAFLQQSALAWNSEMLEVAELVQHRLLSATQADKPQDQPPFARAA